MNQHIICPACHSSKIFTLSGFEKESLMKCYSCKLTFARNIPSEKELSSHYDQYGRNDYLSPITKKRYRDLLKAFESYRSERNNILDIGCGMGYFLDEAKDLKWNVYGTEFTDDALSINETKGLNMFKGDLKTIDFQGLQFDVITSFEVIEHLNEPIEHVSKIQSLLRPGGLFYLTTPNFDSLNRRILKGNWNAISYPEHLCYYNKSSMHTLLEKHGFKRLKIQTDGISPGRLIRSLKKQSMDFSSSNTSDEKIRNSVESSKLLQMGKKMANQSLNLLSMGESLKAWYVKL